MALSRTPRIVSIDLARGVAIIMMLVVHTLSVRLPIDVRLGWQSLWYPALQIFGRMATPLFGCVYGLAAAWVIWPRFRDSPGRTLARLIWRLGLVWACYRFCAFFMRTPHSTFNLFGFLDTRAFEILIFYILVIGATPLIMTVALAGGRLWPSIRRRRWLPSVIMAGVGLAVAGFHRYGGPALAERWPWANGWLIGALDPPTATFPLVPYVMFPLLGAALAIAPLSNGRWRAVACMTLAGAAIAGLWVVVDGDWRLFIQDLRSGSAKQPATVAYLWFASGGACAWLGLAFVLERWRLGILQVLATIGRMPLTALALHAVGLALMWLTRGFPATQFASLVRLVIMLGFVATGVLLTAVIRDSLPRWWSAR